MNPLTGFNNTIYSHADKNQFDTYVETLKELNEACLPGKGPAPTNKEIICYLKYFQNTLLTWIKENYPCFIQLDYAFDVAANPIANYTDLYETMVSMFSKTELISDAEFSECLLSCMACLLPFLPTETFLGVPSTIADCMYEVPVPMQTKLIDLLTKYVIPFIYAYMTVDSDDDMAEINLYIPSILSSVLDATTDSSIWSKLMECLMRYKRNVSTDLLTVLAYGTKESLEASIHLLNRYFPAIDMSSVRAYQSPSYESIKLLFCESPTCKDSDPKKQAVKICMDPVLCAINNNAPPPYYLCQGCYGAIDKSSNDLFLDVLQPVNLVSQVCDNVDCRFGFMKAIYFCFSLECASRNDNIPIRLCEDCHSRLHAGVERQHMNHECLKELWSIPEPTQSYIVDAIVRLWSEAELDYKEQCSQMGIEVDPLFMNEQKETLQNVKKIFCSFHGLWLLKTICPLPPSTFHLEHLGRLFAMLLVWVEVASYASHPKVVSIVEQSSKQAINWINKVLQVDKELYCSCLLPNPPLFARVGHPWNMLTSSVRKNLEILQRLVTLTKQKLIPEEVWDQIMPIWLQEIKASTASDDILKFKRVLRHLFDANSEMQPLYAMNFIKRNLESSRMRQSQEALVWVQLLSYLDCEVDVGALLDTFIEMIIIRHETEQGMPEEASTACPLPFPDLEMMESIANIGVFSRQSSITSTCSNSSVWSLSSISDDVSSSILILDILIKQLTLRKSSKAATRIPNLSVKESTSLSLLLVCLLEQRLDGNHSDHTGECRQCQSLNVFFYQVNLLINLSVKQQVVIDDAKTEYSRSIISRKSGSLKSKYSRDVHSFSSYNERADSLSAYFMREKSMKGDPRASPASYSNEIQDPAGGAVFESKTSMNSIEGTEKEDQHLSRKSSVDSRTSAISLLPELQLMEELLKHLSIQDNSNVLVYILSSLNVLCLRGECLRMVAFSDMELLQRLQTEMLVPCLWNLLKSSNSNMAMEVMPILLHCTCLEYGADILCGEFERDFTMNDWKIRFSAVEKVGLMCQFLTTYLIRHPLKQSAIVHGFCFLVLAVQDMVMTVASKAKSQIQSIKITSLDNIYQYMDDHFTEVPEDRLALLQTYRMLHMLIPKHSPLSTSKFLRMLATAKDVDGGKKLLTMLKDHVKMRKRVDTIPMYSRAIYAERKDSKKGMPSKLDRRNSFGANTYNPLMYYRNIFTLQEGKTWRDGRRPGDKGPEWKSSKRKTGGDAKVLIDQVLDTVAEESDEEGKRTCTPDINVTGETGSLDDEVVTVLISMLFEFLSKETKVTDDTGDREIDTIIIYLEKTMGLGDNPKSLGKEGLHNLRKNPIFVAFLMKLPSLLDGNKYFGKKLLKLALNVLETCVKGIPANNIMRAKPSLMRLEDSLQHAWLTSLIIILYKHSSQEYNETIWNLMNLVKSTIDGHGEHVCHVTRQNDISISTLIGMKMKTRTFNRRRGQAVIDNKDLQESNSPDCVVENGMKETQFTSNANEVSLNDTRLSQPESDSFLHDYLESTEDLLLNYKYKECPLCKIILFEFKEDTINLSIIALLTFIHTDVGLAAPFIIDVVQTMSRKAIIKDFYVNEKPTQQTVYIVHHTLRCIFLELAPKRLFPEIFREETYDDDFFSIMALVLQDFKLFTQLQPIKISLQDLNHSKSNDRICVFLQHLSTYMKCIIHNSGNQWNTVEEEFSDFFRYVPNLIPSAVNMDCLLDIMTMLLSYQKSIYKLYIDSFDDCMTHIIKNCDYTAKALQELCIAGTIAFPKEERNHTKLTKKVCLHLSMVLSTKISLPDTSLTSMIQFFCYDIGTYFPFDSNSSSISEKINISQKEVLQSMSSMDHNFASEIIEYLRTPGRRLKEGSDNTLEPSTVKLAVAQLLATHMATSHGGRFYTKLMVLLDSPSDPQESPDVHEIVTHFRTFSWILLGALNHSKVTEVSLSDLNLFPLSKAAKIFEYVEGIIDILVKADDDNVRKSKSKAQFRVVFILAEIWTVYVEHHVTKLQLYQAHENNPLSVIKEFWSQLTPMLYLFIPIQKMQNETIQLFAKLMRGLAKQCPLSFAQLYPLWMPMLQAHSVNIPEATLNGIKTISSINHEVELSSDERLSIWIMEMKKELWGTERMLKGKIIAPNV